ncbi:MAG: L-fucose isomerase, partial [Actinobacteria bacterium]|nr:L-fucose isomerase [Actinomycetota bacterium]
MQEITLTAPTNRLKGTLPKVGIRPTIDGRRKGIRESLEEQTLKMAKSAASLITKKIKHSNGMPVECVISDTCIGGISESVKADEKFEKVGFKMKLTLTPSWCYCSETMDMNPIRPKALCGFNGTERPGSGYLSSFLASRNPKVLSSFGIF